MFYPKIALSTGFAVYNRSFRPDIIDVKGIVMKAKFLIPVMVLLLMAASAVECYAQCPLVSEPYMLLSYTETFHNPTRPTPPPNGVVREIPFTHCTTTTINITFSAIQFSATAGISSITFDVYSGNTKIGTRSFAIPRAMNIPGDLNNPTAMDPYTGSITLPGNSNPTRLVIRAVPGHWALVVNNLNVTFR